MGGERRGWVEPGAAEDISRSVDTEAAPSIYQIFFSLLVGGTQRGAFGHNTQKKINPSSVGVVRTVHHKVTTPDFFVHRAVNL